MRGVFKESKLVVSLNNVKQEKNKGKNEGGKETRRKRKNGMKQEGRE